MALTPKKPVGVWSITPQSLFVARTFDDGANWYLTQEAPEIEPGAFLIRDAKLITETGTGTFTLATGITSEDVALFKSGGATADQFGVALSQAFQVPAGYVKKVKTDGTIYFVNTLETDLDGDGIADSTRSANIATQAWEWIKANPLLTAGIIVAAFILYKQVTSTGKKKKAAFLGIF